MRAYVATTGLAFALLTGAHIRLAVVDSYHNSEPYFILLTLLAASFAIWAARLFFSKSRA
jgi:hypothetical protein